MKQSSKILRAEWQSLCEIYLPVIPGDGCRYSRESGAGDPDQGWKLHIAATIFTANETMRRVGAELQKRNTLFKAPLTLAELARINSGMFYDYSQIGKFITIYPRVDEDAASLAKTLHRLTEGIPAPSIPLENQYGPGSNVYYRYGAFNLREIEDETGKKIFIIRDPDGNPVPDDREQYDPPEWAENPFPKIPDAEIADRKSPLGGTYRIFRALSQRGKGGVYNAIDFSMGEPRSCVVKEGRRNGEVNWEGLDGVDFVKRETENLNALKLVLPELPEIYSTFESDGNYYLVTEHIEGKTLYDSLKKRQRRLSIKRTLDLSIEITFLMRRMHLAGWAWHDCKPSNIIITGNGTLRPVDFEGARAFGDPEAVIWGTDEFLPPEWKKKVSGESIASSDLYALGAMIYFLLAGRFYENEGPIPVEKFRANIPAGTRNLVRELLSTEPRDRPDTAKVIDILKTDRSRLLASSSYASL